MLIVKDHQRWIHWLPDKMSGEAQNYFMHSVFPDVKSLFYLYVNTSIQHCYQYLHVNPQGGYLWQKLFSLFPEKAEFVKTSRLLPLYITVPVITFAIIGLVIFGCIKMKWRNRRRDYIQLNPIFLNTGWYKWPQYKTSPLGNLCRKFRSPLSYTRKSGRILKIEAWKFDTQQWCQQMLEKI